MTTIRGEMPFSACKRLGKLTLLCASIFVLQVNTEICVGQWASDLPRPELWVTNNRVLAMAEACGILYIGGNFTQVGPNTGALALLDPVTGRPSLSLPRFNNGVSAIASDGVGGWFVGGSFTTADNISRNKIAHLRSDGTLDPTWNPNANGDVDAIAVADNIVYVGGAFTNIGAQTRWGIAALDATTGTLLPWNPSAFNSFTPNSPGTVRAILVRGANIFVGGAFISIGGQNRNNIAAIDANTGLATGWLTGSNRPVYAIAQAGNTIYAGGIFDSMGPQLRSNIAAIDATTGVTTDWNPGANSNVFGLCVSGDTVYAGGSFTTIGGQVRNRIAALDATVNTNNATAWNPNANGPVNAMITVGNIVYAGGGFTIIGGQSRISVAAVDASTGLATPWSADANNSIFCLAGTDSGIYAGGNATMIGGMKPRNSIAAIDTATGEATAWNPSADNVVRALAVSGSTIYVGGAFDFIGGSVRHRVAALDAVTGAASTWAPGNNGEVHALVVSGSTVYIAGSFTSIGGQNRTAIAAVDSSTGSASDWNPSANSGRVVYALAISGDLIYVGGSFTSIGGQLRSGIAALDLTIPIGNATTWNPSAGGGPIPTVVSLAISGNIVYTAGGFTSIGGQARNYIAAIDSQTGMATDWNPNANNPPRALGVLGNKVYAVGAFTTIGGQSRNRIAALDAITGLADTWNPNADQNLDSLLPSDSTVYVCGEFTSIGGRGRSGLAGFNITNSGWVGTSGLWSNTANWSPAIVPDNVDCNMFNVAISGATASPILDISPRINSLRLEDNAVLSIDSGDLRVVTSDGIVNNANLTIGSGRSIIAETTMAISGTAPITFVGGGLASDSAMDQITLTTPINGYGQITAAILNQATIQADSPGQALDLVAGFSAANYGTLRASNGGSLDIHRDVSGTGTFLAEGGSINISSVSAITVRGSTLAVLNDGTAGVDGNATWDLSSNALIDCGPGLLRGCSPPVLVVSDTAVLNIGGDLMLRGSVDLQVGPTARVEIAGDFDNQTTSPTTFRWEAGTIQFDGTAPQVFELAGQDFGDVSPLGFINNFAMGTVRIESGRTVHFNNDFDNIPGVGCEVLYVDTLELGPGSTIHLNGCNIYYRMLDQDPSANVVLLGGAVITSALIGDVNCMDGISGADVRAFLLALVDPVAYSAEYPDCDISHGDMDMSGIVDLGDIDLFVGLLLQGT